MDFNCPICNEPMNDDDYVVAERLSSWSYMHLDKWVKCPKCKWTPAFGKELSDAKPIYWRPEGLTKWFRELVEKAFHNHTPVLNCPVCKSLLELHKIWVHTWKKGDEKYYDQKTYGDTVRDESPEDVREAFQFIATGEKAKQIHKYFIPAGILSQYKCTNWRCKYVRYVTL